MKITIGEWASRMRQRLMQYAADALGALAAVLRGRRLLLAAASCRRRLGPNQSTPPSAHKKRYGLVYGILVTLGVGTLLPWNVMITEKEFFDVRLHVPPYDARVAGNFMNWFGLTFNTA